MGDSRQSSRRVGEWRGRSDRRTGRHARGGADVGHAAPPRMGRRLAPSSIARGMGRSPACWVRSSGWRRISMSCRNMPSLTSIPTPTSAAISRRAEPRILQNFISGVAHQVQDPETPMSVYLRSHLVEHRQGEGCRRARRFAQAQRSGVGSARRWVGFHGVPGLRRHIDLGSVLRRRRRRRPIPLDLRRLLLVHPFRRHGFPLWPRPVANCRHARSCVSRTRNSCPSIMRRRRRRSKNTRSSSRSF